MAFFEVFMFALIELAELFRFPCKFLQENSKSRDFGHGMLVLTFGMLLLPSNQDK